MRLLVHTAASSSAPHQGTASAILVRGLDLMLIDSALEHIASARTWMDREESREKDHLLTAAVRLVGGLDTVWTEYDPQRPFSALELAAA